MTKKKNPVITLPKNITETKLSLIAGIPQSTLNNIINGKRRANPIQAKKLALACEKLMIPISLYEWLYPEDSKAVPTQKKERDNG